MDIFNISPEVQARQRKTLIALLHWIYTADIDELDISNEYDIYLGEKATAWGFEESKKYLGYDMKKKGRRMPVANVATSLCQLSPESKHDMIFLFVELSEADKYLKEHQPLPSLSRSCSFLEHTLSDRMDADDNLDSLIRTAGENDVFAKDEEKIAQFIRACRNDVSHNFWLETEWGYLVHDHAAICVVTLLNSLLNSWYGKKWYVKNRLSTDRCLRIIENEFGFEWNNNKKYWNYNSIKARYEREQDLGKEGEQILQYHYR
ncbi:hypothetical protein MUK72_07340 [Halococcus dombrowskii]|uniref:Uncharacterized protein n=1 Tax=Halococcus dombrowskii TaxID=179637 RepID=A0AAV3SKU1_HALDO|nr:hypothetical protein [Halococcus dombrowskii]UOO93787.1 hypothetical protein MUK72_07340 [Halococcus dombrowskii]